MKVVEGSFGKPDEENKSTLHEAITEALTKAELLEESKGQFFMLINTSNRFTFVTNEDSLGELVCLLEIAKGTIMQQYAESL